MGAGSSVAAALQGDNKVEAFSALAAEYEVVKAQEMPMEQIVDHLANFMEEQSSGAGDAVADPVPDNEAVDIENTEETNLAAGKLQAIQRGKAARKEIEAKNAAAAKLQALQRGKTSRKNMEEQHSAAAKLQAVQRGKKTRAVMNTEESLPVSQNFESKCRASVLQTTQKAKLHYMVFVDGSDGAHRAFETAMGMRKSGDFVSIVHIDTDKPDMPAHFTSSAVKEKYELICAGTMPKSRYVIKLVQKPSNLSTKNFICRWVNKEDQTQRPDFVVSGITGRKGEKEDPHVLGSVTDLGLRRIWTPCVVAKTPEPQDATTPRQYAVLVNGTDRAFEGYQLALNVRKQRDQLTVVHFYNDGEQQTKEHIDTLDGIRDRYEAEIAQQGLVNVSFAAVNLPDGYMLGESMTEWLQENSIDFAVLATRPREEFGSVSEHIIKNGNMNVILAKH
uniref:UspA domain-containing protein n=1 Tax=Phaeomonas parva TaxID=124430 RepID=A0A7S1ULI9_9STRA|mmetsp:Transcript_806/g.2148  ORF Transcript_806/g.2148 Transcript_806/m.2148 type:complete len:447 (+) Transcript_806:189-1529(+)